jgi:hypothetical protein
MEGVTGKVNTGDMGARMAIAMTLGSGDGISNPIPTHNLSTFHHRYIMDHYNRRVSIWFFRLIFIAN